MGVTRFLNWRNGTKSRNASHTQNYCFEKCNFMRISCACKKPGPFCENFKRNSDLKNSSSCRSSPLAKNNPESITKLTYGLKWIYFRKVVKNLLFKKWDSKEIYLKKTILNQRNYNVHFLRMRWVFAS